MKAQIFTPKRIWVDSRVKGIGMSWYHGGWDEMALSELQPLLDKFNACVSTETSSITMSLRSRSRELSGV